MPSVPPKKLYQLVIVLGDTMPLLCFQPAKEDIFFFMDSKEIYQRVKETHIVLCVSRQLVYTFTPSVETDSVQVMTVMNDNYNAMLTLLCEIIPALIHVTMSTKMTVASAVSEV